MRCFVTPPDCLNGWEGCSQAHWEPQRGRETIIAGTYHNLIPYAPRLRWQRCRDGGNVRRVFPRHPTRGLAECRKLPSGVSGRKWILCIFDVRKKSSGTPFISIFKRWRAPKHRGSRVNSPPLSPLSMGLAVPSPLVTYTAGRTVPTLFVACSILRWSTRLNLSLPHG